MPEIVGAAYVVLVLLALVLLVLWIALPFAVFGLKSLVRQCVEEQRKTNAHLAALRDQREGR